VINNIEIYLKENIDINTSINRWHNKNIFPIYLNDLYDFYEINLLDNRCILFEVKDKTPFLKDMKKHIKIVEELTGKQAILGLKMVTRYIRKIYIENRIPFIIENGQIYLPFIGLDLKNVPEKLTIQRDKFTNVAQMAYLFLMYDKPRVVTAKEIAGRFNYSLMAGSRALKELYNKKLVSYTIGGKTGRTKEYQRVPNPEYFQMGKQFLRNPIKNVVYLKRIPNNALVAGLEALAQMSLLNPPSHCIRAMYIKRLNDLKIETVDEANIIDLGYLIELQLWEYDPSLFNKQTTVDFVSLYATLQKEKDERVEQALEVTLGREDWYMD